MVRFCSDSSQEGKEMMRRRSINISINWLQVSLNLSLFVAAQNPAK